MNESPVRRFCESPHRKLIVAIGTSLFGLLVLWPLVDDYFDKQSSHRTLTEELGRARQTAEGLPEKEQQVAEVLGKLEAIESRTISSDSVSDYRSKVVDLVRNSGCQVRRFDVGAPVLRAWTQNDNPLLTTVSREAQQNRTPFALQRRNVVLLVDGSMESLQALLSGLYDDKSLAYLHRLELQSAARRGEQVTLEIEMWLFALDRQKV